MKRGFCFDESKIEVIGAVANLAQLHDPCPAAIAFKADLVSRRLAIVIKLALCGLLDAVKHVPWWACVTPPRGGVTHRAAAWADGLLQPI